MRRLHQRIFVSLIGVMLVAMVVSAVAGHLFIGGLHRDVVRERLVAEARLVERSLRPHGDEIDALRACLEGWERDLGVRLALYAGDGQPLVGRDLEPLRVRHNREEKPCWVAAGRAPAVSVLLVDGRRLLLWPTPKKPPLLPLRFTLVLLLTGMALAVGSYLAARWITRRLVALERGVKRLGEGELETQVAVEGQDEVAHLAERFNWAAGRIRRLVEAQQRLLASASHELRSPLARLRMVLELLETASPTRREELLRDATADIEELDGLVDEILLSQRLKSLGTIEHPVEVDLASLIEEAGRDAGARVQGGTVRAMGDERLLRRAIRNLLENARRYAGSEGLEVGVEVLEGRALMWVADRGQGVPTAERERIFEPFYRPAGHGAEGKGGGVGLGLALVKQIAELHGGTVRCLERDGGGCRFEVELEAVGR